MYRGQIWCGGLRENLGRGLCFEDGLEAEEDGSEFGRMY